MPLPSYLIANLEIQKSFPKYGADVYLRATNLFNRYYEYAVGFPAPGRAIFGGASFQF
jgi:outer membrane receptor protein involved in Fe transport